MSAVRTVPLDALHRELGATMVPFAGWEMPVRYASDLAEHHAVREAAGLFDVSHMGRVELTGPDAAAVLGGLLVSRVHDLDDGRARYTMICDEAGGVIDDLIVTRIGATWLLVVNASNADAVLGVLRAAVAGPGGTPVDPWGHEGRARGGPHAAAGRAAADAGGRAAGAGARRAAGCGPGRALRRWPARCTWVTSRPATAARSTPRTASVLDALTTSSHVAPMRVTIRSSMTPPASSQIIV